MSLNGETAFCRTWWFVNIGRLVLSIPDETVPHAAVVSPCYSDGSSYLAPATSSYADNWQVIALRHFRFATAGAMAPRPRIRRADLRLRPQLPL